MSAHVCTSLPTFVVLMALLARVCLGWVPDNLPTRRIVRPSPSTVDPLDYNDDVGDEDDEVVDNRRAPSSSTSSSTSRHARWADSAYNYIRNVDCRQQSFATAAECAEIQRFSRRVFNVYLADATTRGRLRVTLPDGALDARGEAHDGVVVLDPYPEASFGHLVVVFQVSVGVTQVTCRDRNGIFMDGSECMTLAVKKRCKNAIDKRHRRRNFDRRCEINFLPVVSLADVPPPGSTSGVTSRHRHHRRRHHEHDRQQLLTCRTNIYGFSDVCPTLRTHNETSGLVCNHVRENSRRCETTHEMLASKTSGSGGNEPQCRFHEICDQAVIVSGGWNRWTHGRRSADSVARFYRMLREHGFRQGNVKVFYANGGTDILKYDNTSESDIFPAAYKLVIRYHIQKLCASLDCVDSFILYLNSPALSDGSLLLWDVDHNGLASDDEKYTLSELKADLSECMARQVHVIVDQSYSGEVSRMMKRSKAHAHVSVYTSGRDSEYSFGDEFSSVWTRQNHTRHCMKDVFREARRSVQRSHPQIQIGDEASQTVNLFGAPCSVQPPFTYDELQQNYLGCQSLPASIWARRFQKASSSSSSSSSSSGRRQRDDFD